MKRHIFILFLLVSFSFLSCVDEDRLRDTSEVEEGIPTSIHIDLNRGDMQTRGNWLTPAEEKKVAYVQLLIFNSSGKIVSNQNFSSVNLQTGLQNVSTTSGRNMSIYLIANMSAINANYIQIFNNIRTVDDLNNLMVYTVGGDVELNRMLLMWGNTTADIPVVPNSVNVSVTLNYVLSKVHINLISDVPSGEQVTWTDWKLQDFARFSYLIPRPTDAVNPSNASDFLTSTATFAWTDTTFVVGGVPKPGKCTVFYLFENRRGGRVTGSPADTNPSNKNIYAPPHATALIANGFYQKSGSLTGLKATIYLGANNYNDYNIQRGQEYVYQVTVKGINQVNVDSRIVGTPAAFQANVQNTTLDCHYDWRPLQLGSYAGTLSVQILDETGIPATSAFWLKVSSINLNQFVNNGSGTYIRPVYNPTLDMKTSITGISYTDASQMTYKTYYLYADEYILENSTRSATVRITNSQGLSMNIPITQKGIQTMGTVGMRKYSTLGAILPANDFQLIVENVEEAGLVLTPGATTGVEKTFTMEWGFLDTDMQSISISNVFDYYKRAGFDNTVNLVYLPATNTLRTPYGRASDGTISEQVHNPIFNTYAARYCFEKNRDTNGDGKITGSEIKWYLPSYDELMLIYSGVPSLSQSTTEKLSDNPYYSSTESQSNANANIIRMDNGKGNGVEKNNVLYVRCVRAQTGTSGQNSPYVEALTGNINNSGFKSASLRTSPVTLPVPTHLHSGTVNQTLSPRFAVAKTDIINVNWATACGWKSTANTSSGAGIVATPATGCQAYSELGAPAGTWRVPTQRELYLIYLTRKELISNLTGFIDFLLDGTTYWSSTMYSASDAWSMDFAQGNMSNRTKTGSGRVRCVRDL